MMPVMRNQEQSYTTVIGVTELAALMTDPSADSRRESLVILDCRFDLNDADAGEVAFRAGHIPGAIYVHLETDLSGPIDPVGRGGRHPLPTPERLNETFGRLGIGPDSQVVAYDDGSGRYAARLWWMLRYMGHAAVAVLDGGHPAWQAAGMPVVAGSSVWPAARPFAGTARPDRLVTIDEIGSIPVLVDSRTADRYRGEVEPIDPVAGHIPGALNRPYDSNWNDAGLWRSPDELRTELLGLIGDADPEDVTFYCGSGVRACINLLAMARAGLPDGRLYVGSWSEWSRSGRPVARE